MISQYSNCHWLWLSPFYMLFWYSSVHFWPNCDLVFDSEVYPVLLLWNYLDTLEPSALILMQEGWGDTVIILNVCFTSLTVYFWGGYQKLLPCLWLSIRFDKQNGSSKTTSIFFRHTSFFLILHSGKASLRGNISTQLCFKKEHYHAETLK